jgi:hypothetical protein
MPNWRIRKENDREPNKKLVEFLNAHLKDKSKKAGEIRKKSCLFG